MLSAAGGFELSSTTRVKTAWKKFKELLPVLSSHHLSFKILGRMYSFCVRSAMLHDSETWPLTKPNQHLPGNDRAMIRQICNVRPQDVVTTRSSHSLIFPDPAAKNDVYKGSFFSQSEVGITFQIRLLPLLKAQRMVWQGLPL